MSQSDQDSQIAYFLGIEGEQTGPFSEKDLAGKIQQGQLSPEVLVWWEGQSDWIRISDVPLFKGYFESKDQPSKPPVPNTSPSIAKKNFEFEEYTVGGSHPSLDWVATFAQPGKEPMPVYDSKEGYFKHEKTIPIKVAAVAIAVSIIGFGGLVVWRLTAPKAAPKTAKNQVPPKEQELQRRRSILAQTRSSLLLDPSKSTQQLNDLINQNAKDEVGKEAAETLLNYYRQNKQIERTGDLLLKMEQQDFIIVYFAQNLLMFLRQV